MEILKDKKEIKKEKSVSNDEDNKFIGLQIDGIQCLRAIAAVLISLYHIDFVFYSGLIFSRGVDIFFIISGFIIMYTTQNGIQNFISKRVIKIIPLYWILTIGTFVASFVISGIIDNRPSILELLKSMFFIPYSRASIRTAEVVRPIVGPAHTLLNEMFFYVIFYISAKINQKNRGIICSGILIILVLLGKIFDFSNYAPLVIWTNIRMMDFVLGIILFNILKKLYNKTQFKFENNICIGLLILANVLLITMMYFKQLNIIVVAIMSFIIVGLYAISFSNLKAPKTMIFVAKVSYSYYLIHYYVILILKKYVNNMQEINIKSILTAILAITITMFLAYISWYFIENKFAEFLKKKMKIGKYKMTVLEKVVK